MLTRRLISLLLLLALLVSALPARADSDPAQAMVNTLLTHKAGATDASALQAWLDGPLAASAGVGAEWYAIALSQRGSYNFAAYRQALLAYLDSTTVRSASTRLKLALALAVTDSADPRISRLLAESAGQQGLMSEVFALHLLHNGVTADGITAQALTDSLLAARLSDGGWALTGSHADPDVTAMVVQALAHYQEHPGVPEAIGHAMDRLSALQRPTGDFASYGVPNPESTAQVLIALCCLGIDPLADARFRQESATLLDGLALYQLPDGSFCHRAGGPANDNATAQVLLALTAYQRLQAGQPGIYTLETGQASGIPESYPFVGYKPVATLVIAALAALALLALCVAGKKHRKNLLAVAVVAAVLIALVWLVDVQSADSYYSGVLPEKLNPIGTATVSIRCDAGLTPPKGVTLPADGVILPPVALPIGQGDTAFTLLTDAARLHRIPVESSGGAGLRYVTGIAHLYEFDLGDLSGWTYYVNGVQPSVGCDQYVLAPGDVVEWRYTTGRNP